MHKLLNERQTTLVLALLKALSVYQMFRFSATWRDEMNEKLIEPSASCPPAFQIVGVADGVQFCPLTPEIRADVESRCLSVL
jgi:hypothetical protein